MKKMLSVMVKCPLFAGIGEENFEAMLGCLGAKPQAFAKGGCILCEGDPARYLGIVLSGAVQVVREDYSGNRSIMARLGPADMFAEAFACADVPAMPVNVIAVEHTQVLLIDAGHIMHTCSSTCSFHHRLIFNLMKILATKNLICNQKIEITSRRSTREKLLCYLMLQAKQASSRTFVIPYNRQELADYLEVDRSGLSAQISQLRKEGVLLCEKNRFTLLGE